MLDQLLYIIFTFFLGYIAGDIRMTNSLNKKINERNKNYAKHVGIEKF